jgi:FlaA1/EpsC-like NDP-sugar epimerase
MATPTAASRPTTNNPSPSVGVFRIQVRTAAIQALALAFAIAAAAAACSISGQLPTRGILVGLLFGRVGAAWLFRLDRMRWGEWGVADVRIWLYVTCCGTAMALPLLAPQNLPSSSRFLVVDALLYGVCGLLVDDLLRLRRRRPARPPRSSARPCFVYGSRGRGRRLAQDLLSDPREFAPFAYIDDDPQLQQTFIDGLPVLGHLDDLARLARLHSVYDVLAPDSDETLEEAANEAGIDIHTSLTLKS